MSGFGDFALSPLVLRSIGELGYETPSPVQAQAIPPVLDGRDVLAQAQTGTGKTAAFALPIIHRLAGRGNPPKGAGRRIRAVVMVPTRELAVQVCESFLKYAKFATLRIIAVYGGVNQALQVRALRHGVDVLVATPGRMVDLMEQGFINLEKVETLVLDEADMMFDMGFAPNLNFIMDRMPEKRQNLLFSATMPGPIEQLARKILKDPARIDTVPERTPLEIIDHRVSMVPREEKADALVAYLRSVELDRAIVFTRTKHGADRVARILAGAGFATEAIHGDKRQNIRQRALAAFKGGFVRVLVATDIAARGIDVSGVSHVVNHDMPLDAETYVHRVGRTGRAGASGAALSLCAPEERKLLLAVERLVGKRVPVLPYKGNARPRGPVVETRRPFEESRLPGKGRSARARR